MAKPEAKQEAVLMGLSWETIADKGVAGPNHYRAPVPSGWLVEARWYDSVSITFVPDKEHTWEV